MLTRREAATICAALIYYQRHSLEVVTTVHVSPLLGSEVPLSTEEVDALVVRLVGGEAQEP